MVFWERYSVICVRKFIGFVPLNGFGIGRLMMNKDKGTYPSSKLCYVRFIFVSFEQCYE